MVRLMNLPTEMLLQILSYLRDYTDVRISVPATNRRLHDLLSILLALPLDEHLPERLFQDSPKPIIYHYCYDPYGTYYNNYNASSETGSDDAYYKVEPEIFQLHPCLEHLRIQNEGFTVAMDLPLSIDDVGFLSRGDQFTQLTDTNFADENATTTVITFASFNLTLPFDTKEIEFGSRCAADPELLRSEEEKEPRPDAIKVLDFAKNVLSSMIKEDMVVFHNSKEDTQVMASSFEYIFQERKLFRKIELPSLLERYDRYEGGVLRYNRYEGYVFKYFRMPAFIWILISRRSIVRRNLSMSDRCEET